jgi:hypothetical protein
MLLAIRACANLLWLEMSILRVGALCFARAFRVVSIREAYSFPTLLLCCFRCIACSLRLDGAGEEFFMQSWEHRLGVPMQPCRERIAFGGGLKAQRAFLQCNAANDRAIMRLDQHRL